MRRVEKKIELVLAYSEGDSKASEGYFEGGVIDPSFLDELLLWTEKREVWDEEQDAFRELAGRQINLCGSPRALFELGRYLIALSQHQSDNREYRDYLDEVPAPEGKDRCELVVHAPSRLRTPGQER